MNRWLAILVVALTAIAAQTSRSLARIITINGDERGYWNESSAILGEVVAIVDRSESMSIIDAPDEATAASTLISLGAAGNVRTKTLRAYNREEMTSILGKVS